MPCGPLEITNALIEFGTEAVLRYRTISGLHDNWVPEVFLGGFIAPRLYDRLSCPVHIERYYTTIAKELGADSTPDLVNEFGGQRADVAIYQDGRPRAIIELKIFDERRRPASVADDLAKAEKLAELGGLLAYVGVMICETSTAGLELRIKNLEDSLSRKVYTAYPQQSRDGKWRWCFGCSSLAGINESPELTA